MAHDISTDLRNHIVFTSIAGTDCVFFFDGIEISEAEYWTLSAVAQAQTAAKGAALIASETGTFGDLFA